MDHLVVQIVFLLACVCIDVCGECIMGARVSVCLRVRVFIWAECGCLGMRVHTQDA